MDAQRFGERLRADRYADDEPVEVRAGERYHEVPERLFGRIQQVAAAYELHLLPTIDTYRRTSLSQDQCVELVAELRFVHRLLAVADPMLAAHIESVVAIADACAQSPFESEQLAIEGP